MSNTLWQIAFGPYALSVDRRTLRFDLHDTKAGIAWAESLPLGWIEVENRETLAISRHDFGDCKLLTVSEKAGAQGKRILFGLDAPDGVPVDVYVICTEREIQLTVEASRDTKTHRVVGFGLVPGLVSVPDDGASYLVLPSGEGAGILARDAGVREKDEIPSMPLRYPIWQANHGVFMPFVGAVRAKAAAESIVDAPAGSLALLTDSAYGTFVLSKGLNGTATLDVEYGRDPERRRLDVRVVILPGENHVGVAHAYRDKIIGEKNHVTLRRKIRERPHVDKIIGAAWYADIRIEGFPCVKPEADIVWGAEYAQRVQVVAKRNDTLPDRLVPDVPGEVVALQVAKGDFSLGKNLWEIIEEALQQVGDAQKETVAVGVEHAGDWDALASDFSIVYRASLPHSFLLPLTSVVYHDALVMPFGLVAPEKGDGDTFSNALLRLTTSFFRRWTYVKPQTLPPKTMKARQAWRVRTYSVLCPLQRLTFTAFLTFHRFLTPDALVEEAYYSDKTRIVINRSETDDYENPDLHLPPGGFFVRHTQMEAHDALRVGDQTFNTRAFRIRRALDDKPLELSAAVETREFPV